MEPGILSAMEERLLSLEQEIDRIVKTALATDPVKAQSLWDAVRDLQKERLRLRADIRDYEERCRLDSVDGPISSFI
jgi:hypothetical protein